MSSSDSTPAPNEPPRSRAKTWFLRALLVFFILALGLLASEFGMRWYVEGGPIAAMKSVFPRPPVPYQGNDKLMIHDAELGYTLNPATQDVNSLGFAAEEVAREKLPGTFRVFCLGDSVTWGPSFAYLLGEPLKRAHDFPVEVINAAIPGYTTYQQRRLLERDLLPLDPDLVVLQYCTNDNHRFTRFLDPTGNWLITEETHQSVRGDGFRGWLLRSSYLALFLRQQFYGKKNKTGFPWDDLPNFCTAWQDDSWPTCEEHLIAMKTALRERGARFAVVAVPIANQLRDHFLNKDRDYTLKPQRKLAEITTRLGIPYLDLVGPFLAYDPGELYTDGVHLTKKGHAVALEQVLVFLKQNALVRKSGS